MKVKLNYYLLFSFIGFIFPFSAILFEFILRKLPFSVDNFFFIHVQNPLLFFFYFIPLIVGFVVHITSKQVKKVKDVKNQILKQQYNLQQDLLDNMPALIYFKDPTLHYCIANKKFASELGLSTQEIIGKTDEELNTARLGNFFEEMDRKVLHSKDPIIETEMQFKDKNNNLIWAEISKIPVSDNAGKPLGLVGVVHDVSKRKSAELEAESINEEMRQTIESLENQNVYIEAVHHKINASINYANRIQKALLPDPEAINKILNENFILFKPRDIVSGDFYFVSEINNYIVILAADCTGHGVPGAFMSLLGLNFFQEISQQIEWNFDVSTSDLLEDFRQKIKEAFSNEKNVKDGMDVSLILINPEEKTLDFAGAYNHLYFVTDTEPEVLYGEEKITKVFEKDDDTKTSTMYKIKADRQPIGYFPKEKPFTSTKFVYTENTMIYMFSDGYQDQIEYHSGRKYMSKRFLNLLFSISCEPVEKQKLMLDNEIETWKGEKMQTDDILVIGVKLNLSSSVRVSSKYTWENITILIAEDSDIGFTLLSELLGEKSPRLLWAKNGKECIETYNNFKSDINIILTDINMPKMNGIEVIREIRKGNKDIPIIVLTASFHENKSKAFQAGCNDYITKPINENELLTTIDKYSNNWAKSNL